MPDRNDDASIERTIRISVREGTFAQVYATLAAPGSALVTKFAVLLGAGPFHFAVLSAIGQLSQIFQPLGAVLTRTRTTRRPMVVVLVVVSRLLTLLFGLLPFLLSPPSVIWVFLLLFFVVTSLQAVSLNAWVAWISDMIPLSIRGRFFSRRSQYLLVAGLLTGFLFGALVDTFEPESTPVQRLVRSLVHLPARVPGNILLWVYASIFLFAAIIGLVGARILASQPEHPKTVERVKAGTLLFGPLRDRNFRRLLLYGMWWMLAVGVGAPFWQPFMIQVLRMSLVDIQIYGTISTLASILVVRLWGSLIDRFGNKTCMGMAILLGGLNPLVWLFAGPGNYWMVFLEAVTSGIMWAGAGIIATNFVLAIAPQDRRQIYSGLFGAVSGLAAMATMLLSGLLLPPPLTIAGLPLRSEQVLFGLTGLLRWSTLIPLAFIVEPTARPTGEVLHYLRQFAKVHIASLGQWIVQRNHPRR